MDMLELELASARQRVKRAELSLKRAKEMLDEDCGVGINLALCDRIRSEQRRVVEARRRLMKIVPANNNRTLLSATAWATRARPERLRSLRK